MSEKKFDYIIVGAGSAGCTLANRLTEDGTTRVLLLEAGGPDDDRWIRIPLGWGRILQKRLHDWDYFTEPEARLAGRSIECARGKVLGGSSSINAMAYVRGHRGDYDRWAASGLTGWSFADVLPYFKRSEAWEGGESPYRGGSGPLTTRRARYADPLVEGYIEAGRAAGYPVTQDYNGAQQEGFAYIQSTIRAGQRCSAAVAYLRPALTRANLSLTMRALVHRVVFDRDRAIGVEVETGGAKQVIHAEREVIIAGGTINSPQVLMLSGIGDPTELAAHGIAVKAALPGVGKNLQDHASAGLEYTRKSVGPFVKKLRLDRMTCELARAELFGTGFATDLPSGWMAFVKSDSTLAMPDIQFLFRAIPGLANPYLPPFSQAPTDGFSPRAVVLRPQSRGRVRLASADPRAPVRIHQNLLAEAADRHTLRTALRIAREVGRQGPLAAFVGAEVGPGPNVTDDAGLDEWIGKTGTTAHHPLGTCKMGVASDPTAVVDGELRVRGVRGLRVVDASVMPDLVGGNINAPVIMIAERAADLIRDRRPLAAMAVA